MPKEAVTQENLLAILELLDSLKMRYWIDGGWGVDILCGKQNREHRDVDIDFDAAFTETLLDRLQQAGYEITTDWRPCRIELYHPQMGCYIDIHPLIIAEDGSARQAAPDGGWYEFEADYFGRAPFGNRIVTCISAKAQKLFHTGYELREQDEIDMRNLNAATMEQVPGNAIEGNSL
jgi:lincosamide nucleotidyltransferase A/C/D/E